MAVQQTIYKFLKFRGIDLDNYYTQNNFLNYLIIYLFMKFKNMFYKFKHPFIAVILFLNIMVCNCYPTLAWVVLSY